MATWAVSSEIVFKSNAVALFESMTAAARTLTDAMAALNAELKVFNQINAAMPRALGRTTGAFTRQVTRVNEATAAMERYGVAAKEAGMVTGPRSGGSKAAEGAAVAGPSALSRVGTGLAITAAIGSYVGLKNSMDLQNYTVQTAIASGRMGNTLDQTTANMAPTVELGYKMSAMTGGSVAQMMEVIQQLASSGLSLKQIADTYKPIAQATDMLHFGKDKMEFGDAATTIAGAMHSLGLYNEADTKFGLNRVVDLGYESPHGVKELMTQARLFAPTFERRAAGTTQQKADEVLTLTSWMDRLGVLQRGGSGLNMLATYLTNPKTPPQRKAFFDLGISDKEGRTKFEDANGKVDYLGILKKVSADYVEAQKHGKGAIDKVNDALDSLSRNASRYFMQLTTPQALAQLKKLQDQTAHMPSLDQKQKQLMETLGHALQRFGSDIQSVLTTLVMPAVPALAKFVVNLAETTEALGQFFRDHPTATKIGGAALLGGGAAGVVIAAKMLTHFMHGNSVLVRELITKMGEGGAGSVVKEASAVSRTGGILSGAGEFLFGVSGMARFKTAFAWVPKMTSALGNLSKFGLRAALPITIAAAAIASLAFLMSHPIQVGKFVGNVEGMFVNIGNSIHGMWTGLMGKMWNTTGKGTTDIVGAFATMFGIIIDGIKLLYSTQFKLIGDLASHNFGAVFKDIQDFGSGAAGLWARYKKAKNDNDWANMERDRKFQEGKRKGFQNATGTGYNDYYTPPVGPGPRLSLLPTITLAPSTKPQPVMLVNKDKQQHTIGSVSIVVNSKSDTEVPNDIIRAFQSQLGIRVGSTTPTSPHFTKGAAAGVGRVGK